MSLSRRCYWLFVIQIASLILFAGLQSFGQPNAIERVSRLFPNRPLERAIEGGKVHSYKIPLDSGQYIRLIVDQNGIDLVVTLLDPGGRSLVEVDGPNGNNGIEPVSYIAGSKGNYSLEIKSLDPSARAGRYEVRISELRPSTKIDESRVKDDLQAQKAFEEGFSLRSQGIQNIRSAIIKFRESASLFHSAGNVLREAEILHLIGVCYREIGENQQALTFYNQSLSLARTIPYKIGEAITLNDMGLVYANLRERKKALQYYFLALSGLHSSGGDEGPTLGNIGEIYSTLQDYPRALDYYNRAVTYYEKNQDKTSKAVALNSLGLIYKNLNTHEKALDCFDEALRHFQSTGNKEGEMGTLSNISLVYFLRDENAKAIELLQRVLEFDRARSDKFEEANDLNGIGLNYRALKEPQKALTFLENALEIRRSIGHRRGEAITLNNIGLVYRDLGDSTQALTYYNRALPIYHSVEDKVPEAILLNNMMFAWNDLGNSSYAVAIGKQSVNIFQELRNINKGLDTDNQQGYLKSIEGVYRNLASILIRAKRNGEAHQIITFLKDQQYFDTKTIKQLTPVSLTPRETSFLSRLNERLERTVKVSSDLEKANVPKQARSIQEDQNFELLKRKAQDENDQYLDFIRSTAKEFAGPLMESDNIQNPDDLRTLQAKIGELSQISGQKTVAVYTLLSEHGFNAIIVSSDKLSSVFLPTQRNDLNRKAKELWALLQSDQYDPALLSNELYKAFFEPIVNKLPKDTKTIMWSLDDNLHYLPIAALFDGEKYLIERYNNVVFSRANVEQWLQPSKPTWTGIGLGSSDARNVEYKQKVYVFDSLTNTRRELNTIFKTNTSKAGFFPGSILSDGRFTRKTMIAGLKSYRPLVHISSHFYFSPGDPNLSFLLLGDGNAFSLNEMRRYPDLFRGVELLTLSACETAAQRPDSNGKEVDAFSELAQRLGAQSVIATLWRVRDESSYWLMRDFYQKKRNKPNVTKIEALIQAQIALLHGTTRIDTPLDKAHNSLKSSGNSTIVKVIPEGTEYPRNKEEGIVFVEAKYAKPFTRDRTKPYAHPYYWSPFVLFGNWR